VSEEKKKKKKKFFFLPLWTGSSVSKRLFACASAYSPTLSFVWSGFDFISNKTFSSKDFNKLSFDTFSLTILVLIEVLVSTKKWRDLLLLEPVCNNYKESGSKFWKGSVVVSFCSPSVEANISFFTDSIVWMYFKFFFSLSIQKKFSFPLKKNK